MKNSKAAIDTKGPLQLAVSVALAGALALGLSLSNNVHAADTQVALEMLRDRAPSYPASALRSRQTGTVVLAFDIDERGRANNVTVVESTDRAFSESAQRALSASRFKVPEADGERMSVSNVQKRYVFALPE